MSDRTSSWNLSTFFPLIPARTTHIAYLDFRAGSWVLSCMTYFLMPKSSK